MTGINNIISQAKKMQEKIGVVQKDLADRTVEATSGGGMVTVVANGKNQIISLKIDPTTIQDGDLEMLEDLVTAAVNEALRRSQQMMTEEMSKITGGINIPGLV